MEYQHLPDYVETKAEWVKKDKGGLSNEEGMNGWNQDVSLISMKYNIVQCISSRLPCYSKRDIKILSLD